MDINKQKVLNFVLTLEAGGQKIPQTFLEGLERQNMENQTIFKLYTDDNKSKYSSNHMNILKSAKKNTKLCTKSTSRAATNEFVWKIPNRKNDLMNTLFFVRLKYR